MSTNTDDKKSVPSDEQLAQMVSFLISNPELAGEKFQRLHGKLESDQKWSELADRLNCLGGAIRSVDQWRVVWNDLKNRTMAKQRAITEADLERRIIAIIGDDNIDDHNSVSENSMSEDEDQQLPFENGGDFVLKHPLSPKKEEESEEDLSTSSSSISTTRRALKRKHTDDSDTKKAFLEIAKQQADALKMLAETNATNLEVNKVMADAINTMAEGLKAVAEAFNNISHAINGITAKTNLFVNVLEKLAEAKRNIDIIKKEK